MRPDNAAVASESGSSKRLMNLVKAGVVLVFAIEAVDEVRILAKRMSRKSAWWLSSVEQRERRRFRLAELAFLVKQLDAQNRRRAQGPS
jgi:hypothetical protein